MIQNDETHFSGGIVSLLLKNRDFTLLWTGQLISQIGNNFNYIALAWIILTVTGSSSWMAGVMIAQLLPNALLGMFLGVFADHFDKRRLMIFCDIARAVLVASIAFLSISTAPSLWYIYSVVFIVSSLSLLFSAAEKSVIPMMVRSEGLVQANAFQEMTSQIAAMVGPVLAGVMIVYLPNPAYVLYFDGATFLASAYTILCIRSIERREVKNGALTVATMISEARAGFHFIAGERVLLIIVFSAMLINFSIYPLFVVFPVYAREVLHMGAEGFGSLLGAFGFGMLAGSLAASKIAERLSRIVTLYGGMMVVGLSFLAMAFVQSSISAFICSALMGIVIAPGNAVILSMAQKRTPDRLMGRFFALMLSLSACAAPLGVVTATALMEKAGIVVTVLAMGIFSCMVAVAGAYVYAISTKEGLRAHPVEQ